MRTSMIVTVATCGFMVAMLTAMPTFAGEEEDRVRDVEDNLGRIKDKLDSIGSRSSSSEIDNAIEYADKVREYAEKLKSIPAQNEPGKTMGSSYSDYVSKFKESAKNLKSMKDAQLKAENERLTERCNEADRNLRSELTTFVDRKDPNGLTKIPDLADRLAREYGDALKKMEETHREMERWKGYSRNFSESHGKWSEVRSKLSDGANDLWDRWNRRMEESRYKCQGLAKGKDYDLVKEAMGKLGNVGQVRTVIRKKIDEKLQNVASKLKDLDSRSGDAASEVQEAQRSVDDILGFLDEFKNVQGEDSEAKQVADRWPSQARSLKESIDAYKKLKAGQNYLDQDAQVCQSDLNDMVRFMTERTSTDGRKNKNGANEIRNKVAEIQKKWQGKKDDADKLGRTLESYKEKTVSFSFRESDWSRVVDALQGSAGKSLAYYNTTRAKTYDSDPCRQLQLGASAREVDQALKSLGEHRGTITARYKKVRDAFTAFKSQAVDFRATAELTSKEIRDAICNDEEWETKVPRIADTKISEFRSKWDRLHSERDQMLNEIDQLINNSRDQSLPAFKRRIVEYLNPLGPIVDNEMKGANNPKIRAYIDAGNEEHKSRQSSCDMREVTMPDGKRLDCVKACVVIEIKPNNSRQISKGGEQVLGYKKSLEDMYKSQGASMFTDKFSHLKRCEQKGSDGTSSLVLETRIETYNFCPSDPSIFFSPKEPLMNWEPPDSIQ